MGSPLLLLLLLLLSGGRIQGSTSAKVSKAQLDHVAGKPEDGKGSHVPPGNVKSPTANFSSQGHKAAAPKDYPTNEELQESMKRFVSKCSNISRMYSIGKSVRGVPLWVLEISNNPGLQEPKPSFKFVGNLHGNEPSGRVILMSYAHWLCDQYKKDLMATFIIEHVHLHLLPSMNPDGFAVKNRSNANNVDLNRDFPDQFLPQNNDPSKRQPETRAVMNWIRANRFVASASLHEGALVANYPWDGSNDGKAKYSRCPDDETFKHLAAIYAQAHPTMASNNSEFPTGLTNGAAWYPLYGGMQDWNYIHGGCFEITVEVDRIQWPPYSQIGRIAKEHRSSMSELVAAVVVSAVHGKVVSSSGLPLAATITVEGIGQRAYASEMYGDFHRLLTPGQFYEVTASMWGYKSRTSSIVLHEDKPTFVDFILEPLVPLYQPPNLLLRGQTVSKGQSWAKNWERVAEPEKKPLDVLGHTINPKMKDFVVGKSEETKSMSKDAAKGEGNEESSTEQILDIPFDDAGEKDRYGYDIKIESIGFSSLVALLSVTIALVYILCRLRGCKLFRMKQTVKL